VNLTELERNAVPLSGMLAEVEQHQRIRDLIDPPALRWMRDSERRWQELTGVNAFANDLHIAAVSQAQKIQELFSPRSYLEEVRQLEARIAAAMVPVADLSTRIAAAMVPVANLNARIAAEMAPVADLSARIAAETFQIGDVYRQINETVMSQIAAVSIPHDIGEWLRQVDVETSAILSQIVPISLIDYGAVASALNVVPANAIELSQHIFEPLPQREFFVSADLLTHLTGDEFSFEDIEQAPAIRESIDLYVYATVEEALTDIAPSLLSALAGARQCAISENPDKVRHACVSLRTVTLDLLERLAPDEELRRASLRPNSDFFNGKPKTLTRLRYIAQRMQSAELQRFFEADIRAMSSLIDVLHAGTHEATFQMDIRQLRYLFRRLESFLCAIVEATLFSGE
jgi:Predicted pPIWI-associating nuclease